MSGSVGLVQCLVSKPQSSKFRGYLVLVQWPHFWVGWFSSVVNKQATVI